MVKDFYLYVEITANERVPLSMSFSLECIIQAGC
jgi:hypothetical protein